MNKYQNALNRIDMLDYISAIDDCISIDSRFIEDIETLKELVDKEIPMKPTIDEFKHSYCPRCNTPLVAYRHLNNVYFNRCNNEECGQRIDWDNTQDTAL